MNDDLKNVQKMIKILKNHCDKEEYSTAQILGYITQILLNLLAKNDYSIEFVDQTMDILKDEFRKIKKKQGKKE